MSTGLLSLDFSYNNQMVRIWRKQHESMVVMVWRTFFWQTLGPGVPADHGLNITANLGVGDDHVHPFVTTVDHLLMANWTAWVNRASAK